MRNQISKFILLVGLLSIASGCSTLGSLGLGGGTANQLLKSAKAISQKPGLPVRFPSELSKQPLERYIVGLGDTLFVEPVDFDATIRLPGDQVVKPDGRISLGEFGFYVAVDKTVDQIKIEVQELINTQLRRKLELQFVEEQQERQRLKRLTEEQNDLTEEEREEQRLEEEKQARERRRMLERRITETIRQNKVGVRLVSWESKKIYVLGEVVSPGLYSYTGNQTVLDAIVEAGGLVSGADTHQIIVSRPTPCGSCRVAVLVCYDHIVQLGDTSTNYQLRPGDRVFVPKLSFLDDLKRTFSSEEPPCPRCAECPQACDLPTGCLTKQTGNGSQFFQQPQLFSASQEPTTVIAPSYEQQLEATLPIEPNYYEQASEVAPSSVISPINLGNLE